MHLIFNTDPEKNLAENGTLYVVATPIGNLDDISVRALKILSSVTVVAAEDTRKTKQLLSHFNISTPLISYHEHNEAERTLELVDRLKNNSSVAIVSDAGTPSVSDPGFRLIKAASDEGITIVPVPGVSAAIAALSVSGLPTDSFVFSGFPQRKKGRRILQLENLESEQKTLVFYESPKRVIAFIHELINVFGDRPAVLGREMTKYHEEFLRGKLSEIESVLTKRVSVKGECTLVVAGAGDDNQTVTLTDDEIRSCLKNKDIKPSELARQLAERYSLRKKQVYDDIERIKKENDSINTDQDKTSLED